MSMISLRGMNITQCPDCMSACRTVRSKQITAVYREVTYVCSNPACQHVFVAAISPVRTLEQSLLPPDERQKR